jgi:biopolymer transport protein ExbD
MRFSNHQRKRTPSVIIVSLIDVLLVVLIFLMVTTTAKKAESALKLTLPQSKEAKPGTVETQPFIIQVSTNYPYIFIGDRPVTSDGLQNELVAAVKKDPQLKVLVKGDKRTPWEEIVKVIDASKLAQVGSLNFVTEKAVAKP